MLVINGSKVLISVKCNHLRVCVLNVDSAAAVARALAIWWCVCLFVTGPGAGGLSNDGFIMFANARTHSPRAAAPFSVPNARSEQQEQRVDQHGPGYRARSIHLLLCNLFQGPRWTSFLCSPLRALVQCIARQWTSVFAELARVCEKVSARFEMSRDGPGPNGFRIVIGERWRRK